MNVQAVAPSAVLPQPDLASIGVRTILHALSDPVRLQIVRELDRIGEAPVCDLNLSVKPSTVSHHIQALRDAGLVTTRVVGATRPSRLRSDEMNHRFPGLLRAILDAPDAPEP